MTGRLKSEDVITFYGQRVELGRVDFLLAHRKYAVAMLGRAEKQGIFGGKFKIKVVRIEDQIGLKSAIQLQRPAVYVSRHGGYRVVDEDLLSQSGYGFG